MGVAVVFTPEHIQALATGRQYLTPLEEKQIIKQKPFGDNDVIDKEPSIFEKVQSDRSIIVELDTPRHLDTEPFFSRR